MIYSQRKENIALCTWVTTGSAIKTYKIKKGYASTVLKRLMKCIFKSIVDTCIFHTWTTHERNRWVFICYTFIGVYQFAVSAFMDTYMWLKCIKTNRWCSVLPVKGKRILWFRSTSGTSSPSITINTNTVNILACLYIS